MEQEQKNRNILVSIIIILLILVLAIAISVYIEKDKNNDKLNAKFAQIYASDYKLIPLDQNYFIGSYKDNTINVIIDKDGKELVKKEYKYDGIYKTKDGKYLIYNNENNKLIVYIFDGKDMKLVYEIDNTSYVKPIICRNNKTNYIIGFTSTVDDNLYLYDLQNSGTIVLKDVLLITDYIEDSVYYTNSDEYLIVKNKEEKMGVINTLGEQVLDYKYKNIINTYDGKFIAENSKDKYGIIDKEGKELLKFNYNAIALYDGYYVLVNQKDKMAIYDENLKPVIGFKMNYDSLINFDLRNANNSFNLTKLNGNLILSNNYLEDTNGIEYFNHNLYVIKDNKIVKNIIQKGYQTKDIIYTYDKNYNVKIYDENFNELVTIPLEGITKIDEIKYVDTNTIKILFEKESKKITKYFNMKGKEIKFTKGEIVQREPKYNLYLKTNKDEKELLIYDLNNELITHIEGKEITTTNDFIIIDNSIYKIAISE